VVDWNDMDERAWRVFAGPHRMLLRLAGRVPDPWLTHNRELLGEGDVIWLPDTVAGGLLQMGVPLTAAEIEMLPDVLVGLGAHRHRPELLDRVPVSELTPPTGHRFYPAPPDVLAAAANRIPATLDLTGGSSDNFWDLPTELTHLSDLADDLTSSADTSAVAAASIRDSVIGLWRAWRFGPTGPPADGRRVYLVEVEQGTPAWQIDTDVRRALTRNREDYPQVEVFWTGEPLPPYQQAALNGAALLWARNNDRVRAAPAYDGIDPTGRPYFNPDHPRLPASEENGPLYFRLIGGTVVPGTDAYTLDIIDPTRGQTVPQAYRTDGRWTWPGEAPYYFLEHEIAPHPDLLEHLRTTEPPSTADAVALFRATIALRNQPQHRAGNGPTATTIR
jgi:hypothetical protein